MLVPVEKKAMEGRGAIHLHLSYNIDRFLLHLNVKISLTQL